MPAASEATLDRHHDADDTADLRLWLVQAMLWTAFGLIVLIRLLTSLSNGYGWPVTLLTMAPYPPLVALLALPHPRWRRYTLVAALVALYAVPWMVEGRHWEWLPWPIAAAALCAFRGKAAWPFFGLILAATQLLGLSLGQNAWTAFQPTYKTANDALIIFGLYALTTMVAELHATRREETRRELVRERIRLDTELRGVIGVRLRPIAEQLRLAVHEEPEAARRRLTAAVADVRQVQADIRAAAGAYRAARRLACPPIDSPRVARLTLVAIYACEMALILGDFATAYHRPWMALVALPILAAVGAALLLMRPSGRQLALLALLLGPTGVPLGFFVWEFSFIPNLWPFVLCLVLVRCRRSISWPVVAAGYVLYLVVFFYPPPVPGPMVIFADMVSMTILIWVTYSLFRLSDLVVVLRQTRHDLAQQALARQRSRFARDLHDIMSFSLSAVALKGELCRRLLDTDPARAGEELAELPGLVDKALAELRAVVHDEVGLDLMQELTSARALLTSAGVQVTVTTPSDPVPAGVEAALAPVLREAVTNVVRHSTATMCMITISRTQDTARLRVLNDGVPPPSTEGQSAGSGLIGLTERTGGRFTAGRLPDGHFELVAEIPATAEHH